MLANLNPMQMIEMSQKIEAFIPKIKAFLPQLVEFQKGYALKQNLDKGEFLLYSFLLNPSGKIYLYVFKAYVLKTSVTTDTITIPSNSVIIKDECFKTELTEYLTKIEQQGIMAILSSLPMDKITNFIK